MAGNAPSYDAVIIGSGINSLTAAALLAKAGWSVCVLERNDWLGGAIRTAEITKPGFVHEVLAAWHPLFTSSAAYQELKDDLDAEGLVYLNSDLPTAALYPNQDAVFFSTSHDENVEQLEQHMPGDGRRWADAAARLGAAEEYAFGLLSLELWSYEGLKLATKAYRQLGRRGLSDFIGNLLPSCRDWTAMTFQSEAARGLFAPWPLHMGLGPDAASSGFIAQLIMLAVERGGLPVPSGGGIRLVNGLVNIVSRAGGACHTGQHVTRIVVKDGVATGVETHTGDRYEATRAVLANVTPQQLYLDLLRDTSLQAPLLAEASRFRFGRGEMQIHMALSEPPQWQGDPRLGRVPVLHLSPGLDAVSRAVNEAERGLLPAEATICLGQPMVLDASRGPTGSWIFWVQLQELPVVPKGDAIEQITVSAAGWTPDVRERYADRIQARIAHHVPNLESALLERVVLSPADIEAMDINLVGGDIYGGSCSLDQSFLWRPRPSLPGHRTEVGRLYHIGASTHPGPGLGGASGTLVAKQLLAQGRVLHLLRAARPRRSS